MSEDPALAFASILNAMDPYSISSCVSVYDAVHVLDPPGAFGFAAITIFSTPILKGAEIPLNGHH